MAGDEWNPGGGSGSTQLSAADKRKIYLGEEAVSPRVDLVNWAFGLQTGQGQAFGGTGKAQPERQVVTTGGTITQPAIPSRTMSLNDTLSQLHNLPPDKLLAYQQRLYSAGFYPDRAYSKGAVGPNGKVVTQDDIVATINLLSSAQGYVQLNSDGTERVIKTIDEIINDSIAAGIGQSKAATGGANQGRVFQVETSDPATIRQQVTKVGQAILGRALNDQESAALVEQMLAAERAPSEQYINAARSTDTGGDVRLATARVDTEARLREQVKAQNPTEATAYSEMNYVNIMRQMIGGE